MAGLEVCGGDAVLRSVAVDPAWRARWPKSADRSRAPRGTAPPPNRRILTRAALRLIVKHVLNHTATLDRVFHALADPTRRQIVDRLARGPAPVGALAAPLAMSLPAVLQHLRVLEDSGLVRSEKVGRVRTCRIDPDALAAAARWITARRARWGHRLDRLGGFLADQDAASPPDPAP